LSDLGGEFCEGSQRWERAEGLLHFDQTHSAQGRSNEMRIMRR
jgi:hypothetical protein